MTKELIKMNTDNKGVLTVSARLLHEKLEVKTEFNHWIERMIDYGFEEKMDFWSFLAKSTGGRPSKEYALTIDMAKEICMIQRSEIGKKFRQYFIKCEKALIEHLEIRNKSKVVRNNFTNTLKEHGYKNPYEYIQTTKQMKDALGITAKKSDMTDKELSLVTASEYLADCAIDDEHGYHEVNPVCVDASFNVANYIAKKKQKRLEAKNA